MVILILENQIWNFVKQLGHNRDYLCLEDSAKINSRSFPMLDSKVKSCFFLFILFNIFHFSQVSLYPVFKTFYLEIYPFPLSSYIHNRKAAKYFIYKFILPKFTTSVNM